MVVDMNERVSVVGVDKRSRLARHLLAAREEKCFLGLQYACLMLPQHRLQLSDVRGELLWV